MTIQGRSLDDLPLAAYSTGVEPDARLLAAQATAPTHAEPAARDTARTDALAAPGADRDSIVVSVDDDFGEPRPLGRRLPNLPNLPVWLAHPRQHLRDPRLLLSGVVTVGVVFLAVSLLAGGGPGAPGAANASPSAPIVVATLPPPAGDASIELIGKVKGTYTLTGMTGSGPAVASRIDATWVDTAGATLGLSGAASPGTRATDATFVLTWTALIDGAPVTFTSNSGECTVGMAVQPKSVTGSFVCKKLRSDDGKLTVHVRGTYRT